MCTPFLKNYKLSELIEPLRYFLFPRRCAACGKLLSRAETVLCVHCLGHLIPFTFTQSVWQKRFEELPEVVTAFLGGFIFEEEGVCRELIHSIKYQGNREGGLYLGMLLARLWNLRREDYDCIVPVPLHPHKLLYRRYNQAEIIAHGISLETSIPLVAHALRRKHYEQSQAGMHREERLARMKGAFAIGRDSVPAGSRVLLLDDVLTTGATLTAAAKAMAETKAKQIVLLAASVDMPE